MKLNILFLILLLILSIKTESIYDSYSIETFMDYQKRNGLFEIIESIKKIYGQDVAIISCEEINEKNKGNCKKLVTDYMIGGKIPTFSPITVPNLNLICIKGLILSSYIKQSYYHYVIKRILRKKFNENQTNLIYKKIMKRVCQELF